ncbi:hypothetical protein AB0L13_44825 [Saccharopolyspora shandongensis]|uniref:WXG100 family type VII secretion target n=1 Tax=Saccharopolyspora shandongensis TaxID=418495 RepID=UPI003418B8AB
MAATEVPAGVQRLLEVLVGNDWPEGNPDDLRVMAGQWRTTAQTLTIVLDLAREGAARVGRGMQGRAQEAFHAFIAQFIGDGGYLETLREVCLGLADALEAMAVQIEMLRIIIIELLVILALQIAAEIAAAPYTFGASLANIIVHMTATRAAIVTVIRRAIIGLISHLAASLLNQVGVVFLAQFILICQHKLSGFRSQAFTAAAVNAAVGGAVGLGMGGLGNLAKTSVAKSLRHTVPAARFFDGSAPTTWKSAGTRFGVNAPLDTGWGAATGVAEAAAQDAASGVSGDEVYGAMNGAFTGTRDTAHTAFNPRSKFSTNPAYYMDKALNNRLDKHNGQPPPPPGAPTGQEPPRLPEIPREDWGAWTREIVDAVD